MNKAFTLIELLIVVAIIAILAAIAVPNFLEAQVRSKVSRVKSDMRSIGTAIEAYAVDNNRPPLGYWSCRSMFGNVVVSGSGLLVKVTSPVAYMTSLPKDPFAEKGWIYYGDNIPSRLTYYYESSSPHRVPGGTGQVPVSTGLAGSLAGMMYNINQSGISWYMYSAGPSRAVYGTELPWLGGNPESPSAAPTYDATNGTMSRGFLYRTSAGVLQTVPAQMAISGNPPSTW